METPDQLAISRAKTEYRDACNQGSVEGVLTVFAEEVMNWSHGDASFYGAEGRRSLELQTRELFARYDVDLFVVVIDIGVYGDFAYDFGWHKFKLTNKNTGEVMQEKHRYYEHWQRESDGAWKITCIMTNREHPPRMLSEEPPDKARGVSAH